MPKEHCSRSAVRDHVLQEEAFARDRTPDESAQYAAFYFTLDIDRRRHRNHRVRLCLNPLPVRKLAGDDGECLGV